MFWSCWCWGKLWLYRLRRESRRIQRPDNDIIDSGTKLVSGLTGARGTQIEMLTVRPPSITICWPVIQRDRSEIRNSAALTISSTSPIPRG